MLHEENVPKEAYVSSNLNFPEQSEWDFLAWQRDAYLEVEKGH